MGLKITYLETAIFDLKSIYTYIARDSKKYARLEVKKIKAFADTLITFPLKGKFYEILKGEEIRSIVFRNYIIFYSVTATHIKILSIHHHSRLLANNPAFKDEE
jgi:toxin ParE1/3/4